MRGAFDDEVDFEQHSSSGDTEFTLGTGTVLLLLIGFLAVCGACFGFGYIVGHRGAGTTAAQQASAVPAALQTSNAQQEPSATTQNVATVPQQPAKQSDSVAQPASSNLSQSSTVAVPVSTAQSPAPAAEQPQVRPALPAFTSASQPVPSSAYPSHPANSVSQPLVRPAPTPPAMVLWVQIAAVSHIEDAQVLTTALRKHGYTVTARREDDDLIHVRIGPFSTRDEANRWRLKLLDDGYNAEIQQ